MIFFFSNANFYCVCSVFSFFFLISSHLITSRLCLCCWFLLHLAFFLSIVILCVCFCSCFSFANRAHTTFFSRRHLLVVILLSFFLLLFLLIFADHDFLPVRLCAFVHFFAVNFNFMRVSREFMCKNSQLKQNFYWDIIVWPPSSLEDRFFFSRLYHCGASAAIFTHIFFFHPRFGCFCFFSVALAHSLSLSEYH